MNRAQAISIIASHVEAADDATLVDVADRLSRTVESAERAAVLVDLADETAVPRALTARELELVQQAREDFELGRVRTGEQSRAWVDAELDRRRRARATT